MSGIGVWGDEWDRCVGDEWDRCRGMSGIGVWGNEVCGG